MQVFKVFLKVLRKNLPTAMIYVTVFLAVAIGVTMAGDPSEKFTAVKMNICIFDEDDTPESRALTELLTQGNKRVYLDNNTESITDSLYYETANMVITINNGYAAKLAAGQTDDLFTTRSMHTSYSVVNMKQLLSEYVSTVSAYMASGKEVSEAAEAAKQSMSEKVQVTIVSENEGASSHFLNYFRYLPYILISVMINSLCPTIMAMNKRDVRYRTNCSSVKTSSVTVQTFLGSAVFVLAIWLLFNIVSLFICENAYNGVGWLALLNSDLSDHCHTDRQPERKHQCGEPHHSGHRSGYELPVRSFRGDGYAGRKGAGRCKIPAGLLVRQGKQHDRRR